MATDPFRVRRFGFSVCKVGYAVGFGGTGILFTFYDITEMIKQGFFWSVINPFFHLKVFYLLFTDRLFWYSAALTAIGFIGMFFCSIE